MKIIAGKKNIAEGRVIPAMNKPTTTHHFFFLAKPKITNVVLKKNNASAYGTHRKNILGMDRKSKSV